MRKLIFPLVYAIFLFALPASAAPGDGLFELGSSQVKVELISSEYAPPKPGASTSLPLATLGVRLEIEPGWHIYWRNSGQAGIPTQVAWSLPKGLRTGELLWPIPTRFEEAGGIITFGYSKEVALLTRLYATRQQPPSGSLEVEAEVKWLACKDTCVPGKAIVRTILKTEADSRRSDSEKDTLEKYESMLPQTFPTGELPQALRQLSISPLLERESFTPGGSIGAGLLLERLPENESKAENFQFFPYEEKLLEIGDAELALLSQEASAELPVADNSLLLLFPIKSLSSLPLGEHLVKGILVFSKEMLAQDQDAATEWELPLVVSEKEGAPNEGFLQLANSVSDTKPLLARFEQYQEEEPVFEQQSLPEVVETKTPGLFLSLIFAFLGGLLLNLMPCVLPIISIKVMSFIQHKDQARSTTLFAAFMFALGVISSFMLLALVVTVIRDTNQDIGWGFQFQHPGFVFGLIVVVFLLALGFFDIYSVSLPFMRVAERGVSGVRHQVSRNFFEGVLTTALSTPCTAPFLGTALVYAFTQSAINTFLIFFAIGLGLALPYVVLASNERMIALLPKPGAWMTKLKELMGFFLLATLIWLLFVLDKLSSTAVIWTLALLLLITFTFWAYAWVAKNRNRGTRRLVALAMLFILSWFALQMLPNVLTVSSERGENTRLGEVVWQHYSAELISELRSSGKTVFLDFTADWCLTCKANELLVLGRGEVAEIFAEYNVVGVKADWTDGDREISKALESYGAKGVPLYVVLPPTKPGEEKPPLVLGTLLTIERIREAVREAAGN